MRLLAAIIALTSVASGAQPPGERSRIIALRARADAEASVVELEGDRPLSFTTLRLDAPPRVVLDFADARFDGVPEELPIEDGTVRRVGTAAAGARTARVVIELYGEAEFDVRAAGNRLDVRVERLARPEPVAARSAPSA